MTSDQNQNPSQGPIVDFESLSTSLKVRDIRMVPFGSSTLSGTGPLRSFAESRACGKVILCGEHAVVYGAKAIAMPLLSKLIHLKIYADPHVTAMPKVRFNLGDRPATDQIRSMVLEAFDVLSIPRFNVSLEGTSSLMLGAGVGSSASICVSVLRGLAQLSGKSLPPAEIAKMANQLERRFHGNPSGLDTAVVALEQAILFERGKESEIVRIEKPAGSRFPWAFVLLDSGVRSPTINMVKHAEPYFRARGQELIDQFNEVTDTCKVALETGDRSKLADAMGHAHLLLTEVGIVSPALHDIAKTAREIGALATKVTGAGGGGCMLTLLKSDECDDQIASLREKFGKDRVHPLFIP